MKKLPHIFAVRNLFQGIFNDIHHCADFYGDNNDQLRVCIDRRRNVAEEHKVPEFFFQFENPRKESWSLPFEGVKVYVSDNEAIDGTGKSLARDHHIAMLNDRIHLHYGDFQVPAP